MPRRLLIFLYVLRLISFNKICKLTESNKEKRELELDEKGSEKYSKRILKRTLKRIGES